MGNLVQRALDATVGNMKQRASGLFVPSDYIAGKHFGGFHGYAPWIQDCIRYSCAAARGVGPDELSEITAIATWLDPNEVDGTGHVSAVFFKHNEAIEKMRSFCAALGEFTGNKQGLATEAETQYAKVQGSRERGTLVVIAMNFSEVPKQGRLMTSVSAWNPASVEEAKAVPKQKYVLG